MVVLFSTMKSNHDIRKRIFEAQKNDIEYHLIPDITPYYDDRNHVFNLGEGFDEDKLENLSNAGRIYLHGGNTFLFLWLLKIRGMMGFLREYEKNGGILIGSSAGSIIQTPSIEIASVADENIVPRFRDFKALGIVDFMVKPHFDYYEPEAEFFNLYAKSRKVTLYGLHEGDAILQDGKTQIIYGNPSVFNG